MDKRKKLVARMVIAFIVLFALGAVLVPILSRDVTDGYRLAVEPGQALDLHTDRGSITVRRGDEARVDINRVYILSKPSIVSEKTDDGHRVDASCPGWAFVSCSSDLEVQVPEGVNVTVRAPRGQVSVSDASGDVIARSELSDVQVTGAPRTLEASSVEGAVTLDVLRRGFQRVEASSETSDVTVTVPAGSYGTVRVESIRGEENISDVTQEKGAQGSIRLHSGIGNSTLSGR